LGAVFNSLIIAHAPKKCFTYPVGRYPEHVLSVKSSRYHLNHHI
jgi:hypothetical protein